MPKTLHLLSTILLACVLATGCVEKPPEKVETPTKTEPVSPPVKATDTELPQRIPTDTTPRQLLEKTVAAYQSATSYSDHGVVRIVAKMLDPEAEPEPWPCTIAWQKPSKLRVEVGEGKLVSDGDDCFAQIRLLPDQVLKFPTPEHWTLETLFRDMFFDQSMETGIPETILRFPPQLVLLFAKDPLKTLLPEGATAEFREPRRIDDIPCDLIHIADPQGNRLLWISRKNHALVRFDYFVEGISVPEGIDSLRMIRVEMTDARFNWDIAPEAFQMQQPRDARQVTEFQPGETNLLGKAPEKTEAVTLKTTAGPASEKIETGTVADWTGKTVVLCFWSAGSETSRSALAEMVKSRKTFQTDDRVLFLPINLDGVASDTAPPDEIVTLLQRDRQVLKDWQIPLEPVLDVEGRLAKSLLIDTLPSLVILGPKGTTEFYVRGIVNGPNLDETVRAILGGEKPYEKGLALFEQQRKEHRALLRQMADTDFYAAAPPTASENRSEQKPVTPKNPDRFELRRLWNQPLTGAGQVTLLEPTSETPGPRLLVPCEGNMLAVIDSAGKILRKEKPPGLLNDELLTLVRTGLAPNGKHYIGVSSVSGRAVHVYDENLKPVVSYQPDDAAKSDARSSPKRFVADFRFADVYGNGTLALVVGVMALDETVADGDSLRAVDFQGKEIWRDRLVFSPFQVDSQFFDGQRSILVLGNKGRRNSLLCYDSQGKRLGEIQAGENRQVVWFDVDALEEDSEVCLITADRDQNDVRAESLDRNDQIRWSRPLPPGEYRRTADQIVAGDLLGDGVKEWLVQGSDGTLFVFDRAGTLLDSFSFGKYLAGIAVLRNGEVLAEQGRILVISDADGVTAWSVTPLAGPPASPLTGTPAPK